MGLSSKQVSSDGLDWSKTLLQELPKPPAIRRPPPQNTPAAEPLKCPRCDSTNTKFCYYNNYNKSQPRHFCKACKRHWTKGGTLRNVPVGGGRKNKRLKAPKTSAKSAARSSLPSTNGSTASQIMSQPLISPLAPVSQQNFSAGNDQNPIFLGSNFHFLNSSSNFEANPSSTTASFGAPSVYNFCNAGETMEDSTVTSILPSALMPQPWQGSNSSCWNWDDLDSFGPTDVNIPWDDSDLKP